MSGDAAEDARDSGDVAQDIGVDPERRNTELRQTAGNGGVLAGVIQDDELGLPGEDRFDAGLDPVSQVGDGVRGRGIVAVGSSSNHRRLGADGEEELGGGRNQRDDPPGGSAQANGVARIVGYTQTRRGSRPLLASSEEDEQPPAAQTRASM